MASPRSAVTPFCSSRRSSCQKCSSTTTYPAIFIYSRAAGPFSNILLRLWPLFASVAAPTSATIVKQAPLDASVPGCYSHIASFREEGEGDAGVLLQSSASLLGGTAVKLPGAQATAPNLAVKMEVLADAGASVKKQMFEMNMSSSAVPASRAATRSEAELPLLPSSAWDSYNGSASVSVRPSRPGAGSSNYGMRAASSLVGFGHAGLELVSSSVGPNHVSLTALALPLIVLCVTFLMLLGGPYATDMLHGMIVGDATSTGNAPLAQQLKITTASEGERGELERRRSKFVDEVRKLRLGAWAAFFLMIIALVGGLLTNSMALIAESLHLFSDASSFIMSIWAIELMCKQATSDFSYGLQQAGALGTLVSMVLIWVMGMVLALQTLHRVLHPEPINGLLMTVVASMSLISNLLLMATLGHVHADLGKLLAGAVGGHASCCGPQLSPSQEQQTPQRHEELQPPMPVPPVPPLPMHSPSRRMRGSTSGRLPKFCDTFTPQVAQACDEEASLAMRAAAIHIIGDILQSMGAVIAGILIWWQPLDIGLTRAGVSRWSYVDATITIIFITMCGFTTYGTSREVFMILLMACPSRLDVQVFQQQLCEVDGVLGVHDVHVWQIGQSRVCTAHVAIANQAQRARVLNACAKVAQRKQFSVDHATFQIEVGENFAQICETMHASHSAIFDVATSSSAQPCHL